MENKNKEDEALEAFGNLIQAQIDILKKINKHLTEALDKLK